MFYKTTWLEKVRVSFDDKENDKNLSLRKKAMLCGGGGETIA